MTPSPILCESRRFSGKTSHRGSPHPQLLRNSTPESHS
jgi:hypothetical protein